MIRTLGKGLVDIESPQGLAAETSSAVVILVSSNLGFPLSTTHVASGSIMGSGVGRGSQVRWSTARRMAVAWLVTLPAAALVGAGAEALQSWLGGTLGNAAVLVLLVGVSTSIVVAARRSAVTHQNVNDDWSEPARQPRRPATV